MSAARASTRALQLRLGELTLNLRSLSPYLRFEPGRYTRNLIYRDHRLELLVLAWSTDSKTPIHDHGQQACWVSVLSGAFMVEDFRRVSGGHAPGPAELEPLQRVTCGPGSVDRRAGKSPLHRVSLLPSYTLGVTLHLYVGPVDHCLVFDRGRCERQALLYDSIRGRPARPPLPSSASAP
jgi:cysteine dioxygenase